MPVLFRPTNAQAIVLRKSSPALLSGITVSSGGSFGGANAQALGTAGILVTGVALSYGVNIAYFTTLSESVYVYPLGNKIGKCVITGAALPTCSTDNYSNVEKLVKFYNSNKASNFSNVTNPIQIVIGSTTISGYLENMEINIGSRPDSFGVAQFTLMLSVMPAGQK